jgi:hypothetical protein
VTTDTIHTITGSVALLLIAAGAGVALGVGYAAMLVGGILLAGTIYARTR